MGIFGNADILEICRIQLPLHEALPWTACHRQCGSRMAAGLVWSHSRRRHLMKCRTLPPGRGRGIVARGLSLLPTLGNDSRRSPDYGGVLLPCAVKPAEREPTSCRNAAGAISRAPSLDHVLAITRGAAVAGNGASMPDNLHCCAPASGPHEIARTSGRVTDWCRNQRRRCSPCR